MFDYWLEESKQQPDFIVALLDRVLREAARAGASDIHFQPGRSGVEIRFRIDGVLHIIGTLPLEHAGQIAARLKVLAGLLTYKTDVPQEGRVRGGRIEGIEQELRISTVPTLFGERVVIRFFSPETRCQFIEDLGFDPETAQHLHAAVERSSGAVLITGPSGSGKTTTAYALLRQLAQHGEITRSIVSLEDPVEHAIDGVAQIEVSSDFGTEKKDSRAFSLSKMLQYTMRQDPEVLMVGEIRERYTAETALQAALTGHLLISTFHAGSAAETVSRFLEMGIEPFVLRSSISLILCQRLLRKLCSCAEEVNEPLELSLRGEKFLLQKYFKNTGCPKCNFTGYTGRFPIAEALPLESSRTHDMILKRQSTEFIETAARKSGMNPLTEQIFRYIETGKTSPAEAKRVLGG